MGSNRLEGRTALVTGAGSGIGRASALRFAAEGAAVMCADIDQQAAEGTVALITEQQGRADSIGVDVSDSQQVSDAIARCTADLGGMHVLFNNAGVGGGFDWDQTIAVNLTGVFNGLKHGADHMARNGGGAIINVASVAGYRHIGAPIHAYAAAKAGVVQLSRAIGVSYAKEKIRCNTVVPGLMHTPLVEARLATQRGNNDAEALIAKRHAQVPMGHMGDAWDIAYAALYLASDEAKYVTATEIVVDGGLVMSAPV